MVVAAVGGSVAYVFLSGQDESSETIKIGILADLDATNGRDFWQGAILATEQLNAEGGILGNQVKVIGEDSDGETSQDMLVITNALNRLITYHKVDFIMGILSGDAGLVCQDKIAEHKKILIQSGGGSDTFTQRVLDDYEKYKYFFRVGSFNSTSVFQGMTDGLLLFRENTGFNKVGYVGEDTVLVNNIMEGLDYVLPEVYGFEVVYKNTFPVGTVDFSSYFAAAEEAGVEILVPLIVLDEGIPFVKEYYDRQSPMVVYGGVLLVLGSPESWKFTNGKCEYITISEMPTTAGYPWTSKTLQTRDAYFSRWGETISWVGAIAYDNLRFILADAIERAGTIETEAVIKALEETSIETSYARNYVITRSHDLMMGENPNNPDADYTLVMYFQWQNGEMVPVYPKKIMEEAGASYTFPDWSGPWDNLD